MKKVKYFLAVLVVLVVFAVCFLSGEAATTIKDKSLSRIPTSTQYVIRFDESSYKGAVYRKTGRKDYFVQVGSFNVAFPLKRTRFGNYKVSSYRRWTGISGKTQYYYCTYIQNFTGYIHSPLWKKGDYGRLKYPFDLTLYGKKSGGCLRVPIFWAQWIYKNVKAGTGVRIQR